MGWMGWMDGWDWWMDGWIDGIGVMVKFDLPLLTPRTKTADERTKEKEEPRRK